MSIAFLKRQKGLTTNLQCQAQGFPAPLFRYMPVFCPENIQKVQGPLMRMIELNPMIVLYISVRADK